MTQPTFVPVGEADQIRPALRLQTPDRWTAIRPAELGAGGQRTGRGFGKPGPDQGYALRLAHRLEPDLMLTEGEASHDVVLGLALVASRRAGMFGRAPTIFDVKVAATLFGFSGDAPAELVAERRSLFSGVAHDYVVQRRLVDSVPEAALRRSPTDLEGCPPGAWRQAPTG
jgi:hypothetical protein